VSADVDGELSTFERVLLANHLARCSSCRAFRVSVDGMTKTLRTAPLERFEVAAIGRLRRRASLRVAPAVAAMAVAVVGLGSILASSDVRTGSVASVQQPASAALDTTNLMTSKARERLRTLNASTVPRIVNRSLRGGPVIHEQ
jgi:predicted anti-sigma-YlaC factor YlaD